MLLSGFFSYLLVASLVGASPLTHELEARTNKCLTSTNVANTAIIKTGVAHPQVFCAWFLTDVRVRSPLPGISANALVDACKCLRVGAKAITFPDAPATKIFDPACPPVALAKLKAEYKNTASFCSFYQSYPRKTSPMENIGALGLWNACSCTLGHVSNSKTSTSTSTTAPGRASTTTSSTIRSTTMTSAPLTTTAATSTTTISSTTVESASPLGTGFTSSGEVTAADDSVWVEYPNTDFYGNDLVTTSATDLLDCINQANTAWGTQCKGVLFNSGYCYQKSDVSTAQQTSSETVRWIAAVRKGIANGAQTTSSSTTTSSSDASSTSTSTTASPS